MKLVDPSLLFLVVSNLLAMALAYARDWGVGEILWIYWGQSAAIGITFFIRVVGLKQFSTTGLTGIGRPVPPTTVIKVSMAVFFMSFYGFTLLTYADFIWSEASLIYLPMEDFQLVLIGVAAFVATHVYSLVHNWRTDFHNRKPNINLLMSHPYLRILPMHAAIVVGGALEVGSLFTLMALKSFADVVMHVIEHALLRRPAAA